MVKVVFYKSGNNYYGFREYGHAGFDEAGKDIVCAALSAMTGTREPEQIARLPQLPVRHSAVCDKEDMAQAVLDAIR